MIVSAIGDIITLTFFFSVRDEGSWLDIGTSISHFCIASLLCIFVAALEGLSEVFVRGLNVGGQDGPGFEVGDAAGADKRVNGDANGSELLLNGGNGHERKQEEEKSQPTSDDK